MRPSAAWRAGVVELQLVVNSEIQEPYSGAWNFVTTESLPVVITVQ